MLGPVPRLSLGWQVAHWMETLLCHGPGDVEGEPLRLEEDYLEALVRAYAVREDDGRRLVRRYVLSRPKGRAKSEWAGGVVCVEALGPARFDHWAVQGETSWWGYEYEPGEPVGHPVQRPFVRCLATEEGQAGNTYDNVVYMLSEGRIGHEVSGIDVGLTRTFLPGSSGEIVPSTAADSSKDGGKETFAVFDETHLYTLSSLRGMHATVRRNLTKRKAAQPWSLETTTMYEKGAESVAETTHRAIEAGRARPDTVFDHREGPDPESFDWDDDEQLEKAIREAYRPATWPDFEAKVAEIRDPETAKSDAVRYFLNRAHDVERDVVPLSVWDRLARPGAEIEPGERILAAFDGSDSDDSTGLLIQRASDGLVNVAGLWEPAGSGWRVPRRDVHDTVARMFATWDVVLFYADPSRWETDIDEWAGKYGGDDDRVLAFPQSPLRLWRAGRRLATIAHAAAQAADRDDDDEVGVGVVFSEMLAHDGNEDLRRHVGNATRQRTGGRGSAQEARWRSAKKHPARKIDLLRCLEMVVEARGDAISRGLIHPTEREPVFIFT